MEKVSAARAMEWSIELEKGLRSNKPASKEKTNERIRAAVRARRRIIGRDGMYRWMVFCHRRLYGIKPFRAVLSHRVEIIEHIGKKLQQWSTERSITITISDIYGLVPGEERLFINTILLRLADAFCNGDNHMRDCILKIFLLESKHLIKKGKRYDGILAKRRVPNHMELLKRIKSVFDTGDAEAKALALCMFGSCADLAKDSADIHYMILRSLQSSHDSEVKASLFAAGCFCRLSEDFARIVMEMFTNIISSPQVSSNVKLEAFSAYSKMRCSSTIANRAYKAGKQLMLSLQQDEYKAEMLSSLSKLAYNSSLLIPEQIDLLLSFSSCGSSLIVRARALKCLHFLANRGVCGFPFNETVLVALLSIIDDSELPPNFHCEALQILRTIFRLSDFSDIDMPAFCKLISTLQAAARSSVKEKRSLALGFLVDCLCSLKREMWTNWCSDPEKWHAILFHFHVSFSAGSLPSFQDGPTLFVCHVILLLIDRINFLMDQLIALWCGKHTTIPDDGALPELKPEFKSLFDLILRLAHEYPSSIPFALDKLRCLFGKLGKHSMESLSACQEASEMKLGDEIQNPTLTFCKSGHKLEISTSEFMLYICSFMNACLRILDASGSFNSEVYHMVKHFVDFTQHNGYCTSNMYEIFFLQMHAYVLSKNFEVTSNETQDFRESIVGAELDFSRNVCWVTLEVQALNFAKKMLTIRDNWTTYRIGKKSCCLGAWFTATYTFRKLVDVVELDFFRGWFRSLMLLAGSESEIKLLLFPKVGTDIINAMQTETYCEKPFTSVEEEMSWYADRDSELCGTEAKLARVYNRIRASEESLAASGASGGVYYFQRWFLSLRAKVLISVVEVLGILDPHKFTDEKSDKCFDGKTGFDFARVSQTMRALVSEFTQISFQFNNLAREYDLLAVSFLDIDLRSSRNISNLALSCSVLAFCNAFALYFLTTPTCKYVTSSCFNNKSDVLYTSIIKDLVERLRNIDNITAAKLQQLMAEFEKVTDSLHTRTEMNSYSFIDRSVLLVYKFAILGILQIQEDAKAVKDEEGLCVLVVRGVQHLTDTVRKWMEIPFRTPYYFFSVRPCMGAELYVFSTDGRCTDGLSNPPGCHLSLNLSIQLVNVSTKSHTLITDIYCILAVKPSDCLTSDGGEREKQEQQGFQARKTNEILELNEMLLWHMRTGTKNDTLKQHEVDGGIMATAAFVHFELNGKGQGFSTCVMDVSALHEGTYPIKWHSCCVDKKHNYWNLLPMNPCSVFTIRKS